MRSAWRKQADNGALLRIADDAGVSGAAVFTLTSWLTLSAMRAAIALTDRLLDRPTDAAQRTITSLTMQSGRRRQVPRQQILAWLIGLVLLLPMAQLAALWHGMSHLATATATSPPADDQAPHEGHCDLCLGAAALGGGALPGAPLSFHLVALRHLLPQSSASPIWLALVSLAYQSRAPHSTPT